MTGSGTSHPDDRPSMPCLILIERLSLTHHGPAKARTCVNLNGGALQRQANGLLEDSPGQCPGLSMHITNILQAVGLLDLKQVQAALQAANRYATPIDPGGAAPGWLQAPLQGVWMTTVSRVNGG